ncbi:MAG: IreB family regulatory phosphoprotein [Culicoidibacterales bacterium]
MSLDKTIQFDVSELKSDETREILLSVYHTLEDKNYNAIEQIMGYLLSGDPAYIPRHNDARNLIRRINRDEIIKELLRVYLQGE